ncbi:MAG: hypothetical protein KGQ41_07955, partial [Alphaproteobacteria bacterium]|nr:hypothetical protein [Alphaproteobacteria bacterium]
WSQAIAIDLVIAAPYPSTMTEINAVEFKTFINGSHTADGSHGLFKFSTDQGEFTVAIPDDQLGKLMAVVSNIAAANAKIKSGNKAQKHAFQTAFWNFDLDEAKTPTLTFKVAGGMEMSFQVGKSNLPLMREALEKMEAAIK